MTRTTIIAALAGPALLFAAPFVQAADIDVLIDRNATDVEVFVSTRADNFGPIFRLPDTALASADGRVPFDVIRLKGTEDVADALFDHVTAQIGDTQAVLEPMSMMVHPLNNALPMNTPLEALIAMAVCTVNDPNVTMKLADTQGYAGYIAYADDVSGAMTIHFPATGRDAMTVAVSIFEESGPGPQFETTLEDGGTLSIPAVRKPTIGERLAAMLNPWR